jgi:chemotaxis protein histidine kinase CheA/ActR/RegA family two-component response regulator
MTVAVELWQTFVDAGGRDADALAEYIADIPIAAIAPESEEILQQLGFLAYRIATQALLLGAENVGHLAIACERAIDLLLAGDLIPEYAMPVLVSSVYTLKQALDELANPDESGARIEGVSVEGACFELETLFPNQGSEAPSKIPDVPAASLARRPEPRDDLLPPPKLAAEAKPAPIATAPAPLITTDSTAEPEAATDEAAAVWVPAVDDDMVELFFEEANDRIDALSQKLLEIEQRPGDEELLRDIFRDLHTVKGSSAMVALGPMKDLSHAAEDLVGQLRDKGRPADGPVIDALLAALDGLRDIATLAQNGQPVAVDTASIVRRLRDPSAAYTPAAEPVKAAVDPAAAPTRAPSRQTIRVDFDKLDKLMNLVGELVLGRDGLRGAIGSLSALSTEMSSDRQLTRHLRGFRQAASGGAPGGRQALGELGDELGRVERVLTDISQELDHSSSRLDSVSGELRDSVMKLRMVPVGGVFRKHHRTVRDLANSMGKRARLELSGEETELDKLLVEALDEPLMHLVRNAIDHGIELPAARIAAGKPPEGTIHLRAMHRGNQVVIELSDDGKGIDTAVVTKRAIERDLCSPEELAAMDDRDVLDLIFQAGFSTAEVVSEVSGRGVGMDVVKQAIINRLKGTIDIESTMGEGSIFTLRLPLTLAIIQVLLARSGGEMFAIPLDSVVRTTTCRPEDVKRIEDRETLPVEGKQVPLVRLDHVLGLHIGPEVLFDELKVVLVDIGNDRFGLVCDNLVGKKEIVIKPLGDLLENVPCAAGATLIGDRCALILDVPAIVRRAIRGGSGATARPIVGSGEAGQKPAAVPDDAPHVLLVEDSDIVREALRRLLVQGGYRCTTARDGVEGLAAAKAHVYDLVSTDVMMPRMDGYELTRALRETDEYKNVPIVMVTSRGERIDRVRGFDAGVDEYITKPHDRTLLLRAIGKLLGKDGR